MRGSFFRGVGALRARRAIIAATAIAATAGVTAPAASAAPTLTLSPGYQEQTVGNSHATVTATLGGVSDPSGQSIQFRVISGPDAGLTATRTTDASGHATWTFGGTASGRDTVVAGEVTSLGIGPPTSNSVTVDWDAWIKDVCGGHSYSPLTCGWYTPSPFGHGTYTITLPNAFCDPGDNPPVANSGLSDYSVTANMFDGQGQFTGTITNGTSPGCYTISFTHDWQPGSYFGHFTIQDNDTPSNALIQWLQFSFTGNTVTGVNPSGLKDGLAFTNKQVATLSNVDAGAPASRFTASINWGDGTTSSGTVAGPNGGPFTIDGSHTYADDGSYTITTTVTDTLTGQTFTGYSTAVVADRAITVSPTGTENRTQGDPFSATLADITDPNSSALAGDYSATINWGDGTPIDTASVTGSGCCFQVAGSHVYATTGTKTVTVTVHDVDGGQPDKTITDTINVAAGGTISDSSMNIAAVEGQNTGTVQVAAFGDTDTSTPASAFTATIHWGDGTTSTGTVSGSGGSFIVSGSHTYTEEGTYSPLYVHIVGPANTIDTTSAHASVSDASIFVSASSPAPTTADTFSGQVATLYDNNPFATTADYTATIYWGDGTHSAGTVTGPTGGPFTVSGTHTYATGGNHTVEVDVVDDGGAFDFDTTTIGTGCNSLTPCGPSPFAKALPAQGTGRGVPVRMVSTSTHKHKTHRKHRHKRH